MENREIIDNQSFLLFKLKLGPERWLNQWRHLLVGNLITWILFLGPKLLKERINSLKLSCELHTRTMAPLQSPQQQHKKKNHVYMKRNRTPRVYTFKAGSSLGGPWGKWEARVWELKQGNVWSYPVEFISL